MENKVSVWWFVALVILVLVLGLLVYFYAIYPLIGLFLELLWALFIGLIICIPSAIVWHLMVSRLGEEKASYLVSSILMSTSLVMFILLFLL